MAEMISYPTGYTTNGSITGTNYKSSIGKGSDVANRTGNDYAKSTGSKATIDYSFDFSAIPSDAVIESVSCAVKGHCENTSKSTATLRLYAGDTAKGTEARFTSTTDNVVTLDTGTWTAEEVKNMKLRFTIGYYGGLVSGATVTVVYKLGESIYMRISGAVVEGNKVYKNVNGAWVETQASEAFEEGKKYRLKT
ncbi:MAG: hypothetical protein MR278_02785 [Bacteroidales bacterium]|nr:hypothetical protein [Anaerotignum sp.]MCI5678898.1 hypothetical protein [Bacteroidales bacterium]MDY3925914.1 hypothetical protein [Anaerotignum sp.]